jgi:hypothetical protein
MKDTNDSLALPSDYGDWLADLKRRIGSAQVAGGVGRECGTNPLVSRDLAEYCGVRR